MMKYRSANALSREIKRNKDIDSYLDDNSPFFSEQDAQTLLSGIYATRPISKVELAKRSGMSLVFLH